MNRFILTGLCALVIAAGAARAQTTAFSYQGRLTSGTNAANGIYDLRFGLFNAVSSGSQVGPTLTNAALAVSNGLFTVTLDFTNGAFPGADRWLDIGVRTNGGGAFSTLTPRQKITPTPYAIMAAGVSSSGIAGTYANVVSLINPGNILAGYGADLTGLSASHLAIGNVPDARLSANVPRLDGNNEFTGFNGLNDRDLHLRNAGDLNHGLGWYGTAGTNKPFAGVDVDGPVLFGFGSGVLGTVGTGPKIALLWNSVGQVGIGTTTPRGALEVNTGAGSLIFRSESGIVPSLNVADSPAVGTLRFRNRFEIWPNDAGTSSGALEVRNSTGNTTVSLPGSGDGYFTSGKFGIGKTNPATALDVNGTVTATQFNGPLNGSLSGTFTGGVSANSFKLGNSSTAGSVMTASDGVGNTGFQNNLRVFDAVLSSDNGNIAGGRNNTLGAGIVGAVIAGGGSSISPNQVTGNFGAVGGGSANLAGNLGTVPGGSANSAAGQYSFAAGRRAKANHQGTFVWADSQNSDFASTGNNQFLIRTFGVGINTANPQTELDVNGAVRVGSNLIVDGDGANGGTISPGLIFGSSTSGEGISSRRTGGANRYGLDFYTQGFRRLSITNDGAIHIHDNPLYLRNNGDQNHGLSFRSSFGGQPMDGPALFGYANGVLGTTDGSERAALTWNREGDVNVTRNLSTCSLTIRGGCDVAEPFLMREEAIEPGSVVVIDDEDPGQLKLSAQAYDTRVAGIVSGAGGVKPGIALHQEGVLDGGKNVALSGRVYVKADATRGAIRPGDLLTTSERPGHAMKVSEHGRAQGAILGKAMSPLKEGTGLVLVLVTLQ